VTSIVLSITIPLCLTAFFVCGVGFAIAHRRQERERLEMLKREAELAERARHIESLPRIEEMIREARGDLELSQDRSSPQRPLRESMSPFHNSPSRMN
jgi:glucose-6-phosphate-specific signal transduction histidine kinase